MAYLNAGNQNADVDDRTYGEGCASESKMQRVQEILHMLRIVTTIHPQMRLSQLRLLYCIKAQPRSTQSHLAAECGLSLAAVSRSVDVLGSSGRRDKTTVPLGLLQAERDPNDDRLVLVELTEKGQNLLKLIEESLYGTETRNTR